MAFDGKSLDDYVDVATRIAQFRDQHPDGHLAALPAPDGRLYELRQIEGWDKNGDLLNGTFVIVTAAAYRSATDESPGIGMAWEIFPGRTPYTRGSELMNAETSAWGRAIIAALAADSRAGIASREEVRNRQAERDDGLPTNRDGSLSRSRTTDEEKQAAGVMTSEQQAAHNQLERDTKAQPKKADRLTGAQAQADDPWAAAPETRPGSSTPDQHRLIAVRLGKIGAGGDDRLPFCMSVTGRELGSAKDLSYAEAVAVLKRIDETEAEMRTA